MSREKQDRPPRIGQWVLEHTCPDFLYEEVRGDLDELYLRRLESGAKWQADLYYIWEACSSIRLQRLAKKKPSQSYKKDHTAMIKHYIKISFRNIRKHKSYNFLNIGGLAIGLASFLMIALYVQHELSYDTWMDDADRLYRVPMEISSEGNTRKFSNIAAPVAPALEKDYPQVEGTLRLWRRPTRLVRLPAGQMFYEDNIYYAEPSFFEFFTLDMPEGDEATALEQPNTVVLSRTAATKYFGDEPALGKTISINSTEYEVMGVMEDTPENTHHEFNILISFVSLGDFGALENWHSTMFTTYVKLQEGSDAQAFGESIADLAYRYVADDLERFKQDYEYNLQPVTDIHLYSDYTYEAKPAGSATSVYIFSIIGIMVLFIACLNFINLSTARSEIRAKEVGMRKVLGARRFSLIQQHIGEAVLYTFISVLAALLIFALVLPWYNQLVGIEFSLDTLLDPQVITGFLGVSLIVGLAAGFYPALVLSSFSPISMFQGKSGRRNRGTLLRKVLVVGQFSISVILIVGTLTVFSQLNFMLDKELGFKTEQMLVVPVRGGVDLNERYQTIKDDFGSLSSVDGVTLSSTVPGRQTSNYAIRIDREENDMTQSMYHMFVEYDFVETYGLEIIAGRNWSPEYGNDRGGTFLINEEAVKSFGWTSPEEALGNVLQSGAGGFRAEIVGVFKDFHYRSVDQNVDPLVLFFPADANYFSALTLRLTSADISGTIDQVQATWNSLFPQTAFDYFFLDESFAAQYQNYERSGNIILTFSLLAIFIACLGLYGLAAFSAQQRTKEIGIRKVLGATVSSLTFAISRDFLKLVLIAVAIAIPISWWMVSEWLAQFAYHINPGVSIFILAGLAAVVISILTVSWQSIRAALSNPVESLRSE